MEVFKTILMVFNTQIYKDIILKYVNKCRDEITHRVYANNRPVRSRHQANGIQDDLLC